jgi:hypothetical protein
VRVGRAPIDETAIRLLEQHNPDVEFDWTRILKAPPSAEAPARRDRDMRDRDQRGRREPRAAQRSRGGGPLPADRRPPRPEPTVRAGVPTEVWPEGGPVSAEKAEDGDRFPQAEADYLGADMSGDGERSVAEDLEYVDRLPSEPVVTELAAGSLADAAADSTVDEDGNLAAELATDEVPLAQLADARPLMDDEPVGPAMDDDRAGPAMDDDRAGPAVDDERAPVFEARPEDVGSASYQRLGGEGLVRLRARYAEVMARIAERPLEDEAREELKLRAERLNPDAWVTADEVSAALEQYETVFEGLRGVVGRHPRRRRHGRR